MYVCMYVCVYVYVCIYICVCVCVCMYVYTIYSQSIYPSAYLNCAVQPGSPYVTNLPPLPAVEPQSLGCPAAAQSLHQQSCPAFWYIC